MTFVIIYSLIFGDMGQTDSVYHCDQIEEKKCIFTVLHYLPQAYKYQPKRDTANIDWIHIHSNS